jgi:NADH-ubiquinone oxidoreductase chain 6
MNLYVLNEISTNGAWAEILNFISLVVILCGIFVILTSNPVVSVLFLIGLFGGIASYLICIGLSFIGLSYLIVYVGAVSILFLFILMLINIRVSELQSNTINSIPLAITIGILFNLPSLDTLPYDLGRLSYYNNIFNTIFHSKFFQSIFHLLNSSFSRENLVFFTTGQGWDSNLAELGHITSLGNILYTNFNVWLIITSYILLLAMVGSIVITIKPKN